MFIIGKPLCVKYSLINSTGLSKKKLEPKIF